MARRKTTHGGVQGHSTTVARVLGSEMLRKIQSSTQEGGRGRRVDIETLLQGAEKLCAVYHVPGTMDRINGIRTRHHSLSTSIADWEDKLTRQQSSMPRFGDAASRPGLDEQAADELRTTVEDNLEVDEDVLQKLEAKKKALEGRIAALDRDLGGLRG